MISQLFVVPTDGSSNYGRCNHMWYKFSSNVTYEEDA